MVSDRAELCTSFVKIPHLQRQYQILQLLEVWGTQTGDWIPAFGGIPVSTRDDQTAVDMLVALRINATTAVGASASDIVKSRVPQRVQERVQETQGRLASAQAGIVQKTNDTSENWGGSRGATRAGLLTTIDHLVAMEC